MSGSKRKGGIKQRAAAAADENDDEEVGVTSFAGLVGDMKEKASFEFPEGASISVMNNETHIRCTFPKGKHAIKADYVRKWGAGGEGFAIREKKPQTHLYTAEQPDIPIVGTLLCDCVDYVQIQLKNGKTMRCKATSAITEPYSTFYLSTADTVKVTLIYYCKGLSSNIVSKAIPSPEAGVIKVDQQVEVTNLMPFPLKNVKNICISFEDKDSQGSGGVGRYDDYSYYSRKRGGGRRRRRSFSREYVSSRQGGGGDEEVKTTSTSSPTTAVVPATPPLPPAIAARPQPPYRGLDDIGEQAMVVCLGKVKSLASNETYIHALPSVTLTIQEVFSDVDLCDKNITTTYRVVATANMYASQMYVEDNDIGIGCVCLDAQKKGVPFEISLACGQERNITIVDMTPKVLTLKSALPVDRIIRYFWGCGSEKTQVKQPLKAGEEREIPIK